MGYCRIVPIRAVGLFGLDLIEAGDIEIFGADPG